MPKKVTEVLRPLAEARIRELQEELAALRAAFPAARQAPPRRRPMSAAERKAISERMKRMWAERKQQSRKRKG